MHKARQRNWIMILLIYLPACFLIRLSISVLRSEIFEDGMCNSQFPRLFWKKEMNRYRQSSPASFVAKPKAFRFHSIPSITRGNTNSIFHSKPKNFQWIYKTAFLIHFLRCFSFPTCLESSRWSTFCINLFAQIRAFFWPCVKN